MTCVSEYIHRLQQKNILKSKFGSPILTFGSECLGKKLRTILHILYNNSLIDVLLDEIVFYKRNIDESPNLLGKYLFPEVILSINNGWKSFL